jgi:hypothetical protein
MFWSLSLAPLPVYCTTLSDQTKVTLQQTFGLSDLVSRFLAGSLLQGGEGRAEKKIVFHLSPKPPSVALSALILLFPNYFLNVTIRSANVSFCRQAKAMANNQQY